MDSFTLIGGNSSVIISYGFVNNICCYLTLNLLGATLVITTRYSGKEKVGYFFNRIITCYQDC